MLKPRYPYYLGNEAVFANEDLEVRDKFSGVVATKVAMADEKAIDRAIGLAVEAEKPMRKMPSHARQAVLDHCVKRFRERQEELAEALCIEAGKPIKDARGEVTRLIETFRFASEESTRIYGEVLPMDVSPRSASYTGMWKRVPIGPCSFISPFNFPLNLVAHKVAPAIAVGNPFVLKPASLTPIGALIMGEILAETELPKGAFSILPCRRDGAELFTTDDRFKLLSFTGSPDVGWDLKARAGRKPVILELGGNAAVVIDEGTNLDDAIPRIVHGAFYQSGQSCISVQRVIVHPSLYDAVRDRLVTEVKKLVHGDPKNEKTFIGPMISEKEATRLDGWVKDAVKRGAKLLCGGGRKGAMLDAAVLEDVPRDCDLYNEEAFGPVVLVEKFTSMDEAFELVNRGRFGLQAGLFTRDLYTMQKAWDELEVGGVVIGDVPSFRVDHMPYGGVKDSGLGREGIRFAIEHMTETRLLLVRTPS